jgi:hypothetical protein
MTDNTLTIMDALINISRFFYEMMKEDPDDIFTKADRDAILLIIWMLKFFRKIVYFFQKF